MRVIPFFVNIDRTHCFQAVIRMILKYYWSDRDFTWEDLEIITAKVEGMWTSPTAGLLWLHEQGFEVQAVELFDYNAFASRGGDYLIELVGAEVAQVQIDHSELGQEIAFAKQFASKGLSERRAPEFYEIKERLDQGYLVICNVNSRVLNDKPGYSGHFVLVIGYDGDNVVMHDPGPPGAPNRRVSIANFKRAWAYPNDHAKNYIAIGRSA